MKDKKRTKNSKDKYSNRCDNLVLIMMVKNEHLRIEVSLESVKDWVSSIFIYDTGSTDDTIKIIEKFCSVNDIKLYLKEGIFVDFSISRNVILEYAEECLGYKDTYMLMLDCNDEMQEMNVLVNFIKQYKGPCTGFYLTQRWLSSGGNIDNYYNIRMVKNRDKWRYKNRVHEYITCEKVEKYPNLVDDCVYKLEGVYIFQDRTKDDDKSLKRFSRDKDLLYDEFIKNPKESRSLFYLAQTYACLGQQEEAYRFYLLRIKEIGFDEEVYQCFFRLGELSQKLNHNWEESMTWFLKAFQHSIRVEPLISIAQYYLDNNLDEEKKSEWHTAYFFSSMACQLIFPINQKLFVDKRSYTYKRWSILGISGYYVGRYKEGKEACLKAIEAENMDYDKSNLKFYLDKEFEIISKKENIKCPSLIASTFYDQELRTSKDTEVKFDRNKIINETIDKIKKEKLNENVSDTINIINIIKSNNKDNPNSIANNVANNKSNSIANNGCNDLQENKLTLKNLLKNKQMNDMKKCGQIK